MDPETVEAHCASVEASRAHRQELRIPQRIRRGLWHWHLQASDLHPLAIRYCVPSCAEGRRLKVMAEIFFRAFIDALTTLPIILPMKNRALSAPEDNGVL